LSKKTGARLQWCRAYSIVPCGTVVYLPLTTSPSLDDWEIRVLNS
jgi:hypothetical protein